MSNIVIYHNPRCSKSRQTLQLLVDKGINPKIIKYLDNPPNIKELGELCHMLNLEPLQLIRTKEVRFKELGLSVKDQRSREEWLQLMSDNPVLIERPIVVRAKQAALGRPPENVLNIL